jgi:hypothetical protein
MPRSIQRWPGRGPNVGLSTQHSKHSRSTPKRSRYDSIRVIGAPLAVTLPRIRGIRPSYCSRSDERPAVKLALSMFRLGIARLSDWNGSAVDCVSKALARFCRAHGLATVSRVFPESSIRLLDNLVERSEYELIQSSDTEPSSRMFLMVDHCQAAMVQVGPTLGLLEKLHRDLPGAFYQVFKTNLERWMRVYDLRDAEQYAEEQIKMGEEEEIKESFFPQVQSVRPACLKNLPDYEPAVKRLRNLRPRCRYSWASALIRQCLELHNWGDGHGAKSPFMLRNEVPEMEDYLENTDYPGPGALFVIGEDDLIEACFTEEMQGIGENYPLRSTLMLLIHLERNSASLDHQVQAAFDYLGRMVRSLALSTEMIETIRGIYDADLRQRRLESRVPVEQGAPGVRSEQL